MAYNKEPNRLVRNLATEFEIKSENSNAQKLAFGDPQNSVESTRLFLH